MPFRDRIENLKENAKYKRIMQHVQDNQIPYSIAGGVGIGVVGMMLVKGSPIHIDNNTAPSIAPVFNNMPVFNNDNSSVVNLGGTVSKIVKCTETGNIWEKITDAAAEAKDGIGVPLSVMSKHLNRYPGYEDVGNLHYEIIGVRTNG